MYLKSLKITNFRKFGENNNTVEFVSSKSNSLKSDNINIATATTLIVGKNNSGKTTVTEALKKLLDEGGKFRSKDFNFIYLSRLLQEYCSDHFENFPSIEFEVKVGINFDSDCDLVTNFAPFMSIESVQSGNKESYFQVIMKYEIAEDVKFTEEAKSIIATHRGKKVFRADRQYRFQAKLL